jgi:hypothetical protein
MRTCARARPAQRQQPQRRARRTRRWRAAAALDPPCAASLLPTCPCLPACLSACSPGRACARPHTPMRRAAATSAADTREARRRPRRTALNVSPQPTMETAKVWRVHTVSRGLARAADDPPCCGAREWTTSAYRACVCVCVLCRMRARDARGRRRVCPMLARPPAPLLASWGCSRFPRPATHPPTHTHARTHRRW